MTMNGGRTWLWDLPLEIHLRIIELYIPREDLSAVARTCKGARDLIIPELYRFVCSTDAKAGTGLQKAFKHVLPRNLYWRGNISRMTTIFDFEMFLETMKNSLPLRKFVLGMNLDWRRKKKRHAEVLKSWDLRLDCSAWSHIIMMKAIRILSPNLQYLHFNPWNCSIGMLTWLEANSITSLGLWCPAEDSSRVPPNTLTDHEDIMPSDLYKPFGIPSLRQITISLLFDGNETDVQMPFAHHDPLSFYQMDNWSGSSGVTSVSLPSATYSYATLGAVIAIAAWPKRLEKCHLGFENLSIRSNNLDSDSLQIAEARSCLPSLSKIMEALKPQRESLKDIYIDFLVDPWNLHVHPEGGVCFTEFPKLKKLGLPLVLLNDRNWPAHEPRRPLWQLLPPNLEELQLDMPQRLEEKNCNLFAHFIKIVTGQPLNCDCEEKSSWYNWPPGVVEKAMLLEVSSVSDLLKDLLGHKSRFPRLKKIGIWHWRFGVDFLYDTQLTVPKLTKVNERYWINGKIADPKIWQVKFLIKEEIKEIIRMTPMVYYGTLLEKCGLPVVCEDAGVELSWELFCDATLFEEELTHYSSW